MERQPGRESTITVAAIQTRAITGDKQGNNECALEAIHRDCDEGARLLVRPELGNSGHVFNTGDEVAELAEPVFGGETVAMWAKAARERNAWLCGGLAEADGGRYYNAAALVGPDGFVGRYRKVHLWDEEKLITYKLNEGVTREQYREWSREVDQPLASRQPGILEYEIYEIDAAGTGEQFADVVEVIEAESWEAWQTVNDRPEMKEAVEQFFQIAQRDSIRVLYGGKIEP